MLSNTKHVEKPNIKQKSKKNRIGFREVTWSEDPRLVGPKIPRWGPGIFRHGICLRTLKDSHTSSAAEYFPALFEL